MYYITLLYECIQIRFMDHRFYENYLIIKHVEAMCHRNCTMCFKGFVDSVVACVILDAPYNQVCRRKVSLAEMCTVSSTQVCLHVCTTV